MSAPRPALSSAGRANLGMTLALLGTSLVAQVWLGRRMGPGGLGEYNATLLFITVVAVFTFLGVPYATAQRVAGREEGTSLRASSTVGAGLTIALVSGTIGAGVALALWGPFSDLSRLARPVPAGLVAASIAGSVFQFLVVSIHLARLETRRAASVAIAQPLAVAAGVAASYVVPPAGGSALAALGSIATALAALVSFIERPELPCLDRSELRAILGHALPGATIVYMSLVTGWIDRLVAAVVGGPSGIGAFAAASHLTEAVLRIPRSSGTFAVTAYARLSSDTASVQRVLDSHVRLFAAPLIVAAAFLIAAGQEMLTFLYGSGFTPATTTLQLLAIALLPIGLSFAIATSGVGSGELRLRAPALGLIVLMQLALAVIGARLFSIAGIALAQVIGWWVAVLVYALEASGRRAALRGITIGRIVALAVPLFVGSLLLERADVFFPVRVALALAASTLLVTTMVIGPAERAVAWRLLGRRVA